eukprot:scaffold1088_cov222-Chaetoceros_neogracile.AAC.1
MQTGPVGRVSSGSCVREEALYKRCHVSIEDVYANSKGLPRELEVVNDVTLRLFCRRICKAVLNGCDELTSKEGICQKAEAARVTKGIMLKPLSRPNSDAES